MELSIPMQAVLVGSLGGGRFLHLMLGSLKGDMTMNGVEYEPSISESEDSQDEEDAGPDHEGTEAACSFSLATHVCAIGSLGSSMSLLTRRATS